jgi:hypothetical protein
MSQILRHHTISMSFIKRVKPWRLLQRAVWFMHGWLQLQDDPLTLAHQCLCPWDPSLLQMFCRMLLHVRRQLCRIQARSWGQQTQWKTRGSSAAQKESSSRHSEQLEINLRTWPDHVQAERRRNKVAGALQDVCSLLHAPMGKLRPRNAGIVPPHRHA